AFELVKRIYDNGGMVVDHVFAGKNAQAFVVFQKVPDIPQLLKKIEDRGAKTMTLEELESLMK
ncbi:MAG: hypothetical protein K6C97_05505, partial [Treponema sp.]|nr:hypothetical protein [Treponema sp.]